MSRNLPKYKSKASRFEYCCVRGFYVFPLMIIGGLAMIGVLIMTSIFGLINFFTILFAGQRNETYYDWILKRTQWTAHVNMYLAGATDERPACTPC